MIKWIKGARVSDSSAIMEGFKEEKASIVSVLSVDNIMPIMKSFVNLYSNHNFFFFLEAPCTEEEERLLNANNPGLHKNIYYLDNIWADTVLQLLELFEDILVNDGLSAFGIGNHESEIGKYKYNTVIAFSNNIEYVRQLLMDNHIPEQKDLLLPRDIISEKNPGESRAYFDSEGRSIYNVIEALEEIGLYKAETREE